MAFKSKKAGFYTLMAIYMMEKQSKISLFNAYSELKRSGRGILHNTSGDIYDCFWTDDRKNGVGFILFSTGDFFKGEFREDKRDGFGTLFIAET